jgi:hypothetical protein
MCLKKKLAKQPAVQAKELSQNSSIPCGTTPFEFKLHAT